MADTSEWSAAISALLAVAARVLREAREVGSAHLALSATLCLLLPHAQLAHEPATAETLGLSRVAADLLQECAGRRAELARLFISRHYARWAAVLLGPVLRNWLGVLTKEELHEWLQPLFVQAPALLALEAISSALRPGRSVARKTGNDLEESMDEGEAEFSREEVAQERAFHRQRAYFCCELLQSIVASGLSRQLLDGTAVIKSAAPGRSLTRIPGISAAGSVDEAEVDELVSLIVTLPDLLANALGGAPPSGLRAEVFGRVVLERILADFQSACEATEPPGRAIKDHELPAGTCVTTSGKSFSLHESGYSSNSQASAIARFGGVLLGRLARRARLNEAMILLLPSSKPPHPRRWRQDVAAAVLQHVPSGSVESLLEALIRHAASSQQSAATLCDLLKPLLGGSPTARFVLSSRLLLTRVLPLRTVEYTIALLRAVAPDGNPAHVNTLDHRCGALPSALLGVAAAWSSSLHVAAAPLAQQEYLSRVLVVGIASLPRVEAQLLMPSLLEGVQCHLQSPAARTRRLGMDVAEKVSAVIDPSNPIKFDGDSDEEIESIADGEQEGLAPPPKEAGGEKTKGSKIRRRRRRKHSAAVAAAAAAYGNGDEGSSEEEADPFATVQLAWAEEEEVEMDAHPLTEDMSSKTSHRKHHPDAEGAPTKANCSDAEDEGRSESDTDSGSECSGSSNQESLEAFDLTDDRTDLQPAAAPRHLRQLLSGLRAREGEHEIFTASLSSASRLIASCAPAPRPPSYMGMGDAQRAAPVTGRAAELRLLAVPLGRTLLHLTNQYSLPHFGTWRRSALVALTVACPEEMAPHLVDEFFGSNHTLEMRMEALAAIRAAAEEMGLPPSTLSGSTDSSATIVASSDERTSSTAHGVTTRLLGKTRRFHSAPRPRAPAAASRLATVAPMFFFPLMQRYDDPTNAFKMLGDDCFLLEALLLTLATLLRGAGVYPCARPMARALCDLSWVLRMHEEAVVRRAVLVCVGTIAQSLSSIIVLQELSSALDDIHEWLGDVVAGDVDDGCKALALACHALLSNKLKEQHQ